LRQKRKKYLQFEEFGHFHYQSSVKARDSIKNDLEFAWFKLNGNGCPEIAEAEHVFDIYCEI